MDIKKIIIPTLIMITIIFFLCIDYSSPSKNNIDLRKKLKFDNVTSIKEVGKKENIIKTQNNIYYNINYVSIGNDSIDAIIKNNIDNKLNEFIEKNKKEKSRVDTYYFIDYETYIGFNNILTLIIKEEKEDKKLNHALDRTVYLYDLNKSKEITIDQIFSSGYIDIIKRHNRDYIKEPILIKSDSIFLLNSEIEIKIDEFDDYIDIKTSDSYKNNKEETIYEVVNKEMFFNDDASIYESQTIDSEVLLKKKRNDKVIIYKQSNDGWSMALLDDKIGYILSSNLSETKIDKDSKKTIMYPITDLNVRDNNNKKSNIIGVIKQNEKVQVLEVKGDWAKIYFDSSEAYVSYSYLLSRKVEKRKVNLNVSPQNKIDSSKPMVALTFDDGPSNSATIRILDTLEKYNVHATFFDLGNRMKLYPEIVKREEKNGEIGTHTYSHKNLNTLSEPKIEEELKQSKEITNEILGHDPVYMRPPYGNANAKVQALVDMPIINWDVDSLDWKYRNVDLIMNEIDKYGDLNGRIILLHSIHETTADTVEILIPDLISRGYQIVTISELANAKGSVLETNTIYNSFK